MNTIRLLIAASAMACASLSSAGTPALAEFGRNVPGFSQPGPARFAVADFDRDGLDDIVIPAVSGTALFQVFGQGATGIVSKQAVFVPDAALASVLVATVAGQPQLVTVSQDARVRRFAGWPLVEVHSFEIVGNPIASAVVADIDVDGALDLVTSSAYGYSTLQAHGLLDGEALWSLADSGGPDMLVGQFDADPALEIVVAGMPGRVIDGATRATDWSYKDGFGSYVASGHFQAAGGNQFVAASYYGPIIGFQSAPWSPVWDIPTTSYVSALAVADLDGDGIDDIIEGGGSWGEVNIIDGLTRTVRLSIPYEGYEMTAIVAWDHDCDGHEDVAFGPREAYWKPLFHFADADDGSMLWVLPGDQPPAYQRLAVGRTAAGYTLVYPFGTESNAGGWAQINAVYGTAQWRTPATDDSSSPFYMAAKDTAYTQGGTQLVLAGNAWAFGARFIGLDASSHAVRWILDGQTEPSLDDFDILSITTLDSGGSSTIVACVQSYEGMRLLLVDAASGSLSWTSVPMGGNYACDVMAGRFTDGANPLVVAVLESSLRAYDATTHLLVWTLPGTIDGASLIEQGVAGREFVVFEGSQLRFHDAESRVLLRTFDLGMPVTAVRQVQGDDIHGLLVAAGGHLLLVDGSNGGILHATDYLGHNLASGNRIATADLGGGYIVVGVGSDGGVIRYQLYAGDGIFDDGFESSVD